MIDQDSKEIRRFFDLLGSAFCGLIYSFFFWKDFFRYEHSESAKIISLPLILVVGLTVYIVSYSLFWKLLDTKFLHGYFNFVLISVFGITVSLFFGLGIQITFHGFPANFNFELFFNRFLSLVFSFNTILFYYFSSLPMAAFWFVGVLCSWKFSKKQILP